MKAETHLRLPRQAPDGAATRVQLKQKAAASIIHCLSFFLFLLFFSNDKYHMNDEFCFNQATGGLAPEDRRVMHLSSWDGSRLPTAD
jgi:hypothetical protein